MNAPEKVDGSPHRGSKHPRNRGFPFMNYPD
jgi:hypothetical protein